MEQISMFDLLMPTFKIDKPIRLIEFFAELKSRVDCLRKRMKPLVAWLKVAQKKLPKPIEG